MMPAWVMQLAPLLILAVGGFVMMLVDAFIPTRPDQLVGKEEPRPELALWAASLFFMAIVASARLWFEGPPEAPALFAGYLAVDRLSLFLDMTICAGGFFASLLAGGYLREHELERGEFYPLLVFSAFGAMVLGRATDLVTLFIGLETMSLGVYALAAFRRSSPKSAEGGLKYYLLGSFAAAILLFGAALLYGATGHTDLAGIGQSIANGNSDIRLTVLGLLLLLAGLAFKVSAVPFHVWTPDAYEGAPTPVTAFMSVAVKAAAFGTLLRVLMTCFSDPLSASSSTGWPPLLGGIALVTMLFGNIVAVMQTSVKRMLAYSSIAHAGYILVGLVASMRVADTGRQSVLFYLMAYTVSNALAFGSLILMGSRGKEAVSYEDLAGIGRRNPMVAVPFVIGILSLMGMPPTAGFFAKYYVFSAAVEAGGGMVCLAAVGIFASVIGAYYYLRVLVFMFMKEPREGAEIAVPMKSDYVVTAISLAALLVFALGLLPNFWLELALKAAKNVL